MLRYNRLFLTDIATRKIISGEFSGIPALKIKQTDLGTYTNILTFVTANYQLLLNPPGPEGSKGRRL
jgi:hypothetical protein